jgi:O-antigen/teichoic acid export membrane protein
MREFLLHAKGLFYQYFNTLSISFFYSITPRLATLLRNILIARLIGPEQFGLGVTLAVSITAFEMASDFGVQKYIIQSKRGDRENFQGSLNLFFLFRTVFVAVLIYCLSKPIAEGFQNAAMVGWYQALALILLIRGVQHFDSYRFQKSYDFRPGLLRVAVSHSLSVIVGIGVALVYQDFRAFFWAMATEAATDAIMSHIVAHRKYRLLWDKGEVTNLLRFGVPVAANGSVNFLGSQGDRILVGLLLTPKDLGLYAAILMITSAPGLLLNSFLMTIGLPFLANSGAREDLRLRFNLIGVIFSSGAIVILSFVVIFSEYLIVFIYGQKFSGSSNIVVLLAFSQVPLYFTFWISLGLLSQGYTKTLLLLSCIRISGVGLATVVGILYPYFSIFHLVICLIFGEIITLVASTYFAIIVLDIKLKSITRKFFICIFSISTGMLCLLFDFFHQSGLYFILYYFAVAIFSIGALFLLEKNIWKQLQTNL